LIHPLARHVSLGRIPPIYRVVAYGRKVWPYPGSWANEACPCHILGREPLLDPKLTESMSYVTTAYNVPQPVSGGHRVAALWDEVLKFHHRRALGFSWGMVLVICSKNQHACWLATGIRCAHDGSRASPMFDAVHSVLHQPRFRVVL